MVLDDSLVFKADGENITLEFSGDTGYGRDIRKIKMLSKFDSIRVIVDVSAVEIYINDGLYVMTTKHYPKKEAARKLKVSGNAEVTCYKLKNMEFIK
jgi:beta-fructofuranosidase